jgi:hypothetical protein
MTDREAEMSDHEIARLLDRYRCELAARSIGSASSIR